MICWNFDHQFNKKYVSLIKNSVIDQADLIESTRAHISGYKLPKVVIFVDKIQRAPNGKADYKWANGVANWNDEK